MIVYPVTVFVVVEGIPFESQEILFLLIFIWCANDELSSVFDKPKAYVLQFEFKSNVRTIEFLGLTFCDEMKLDTVANNTD
jgi:hypothetical protein